MIETKEIALILTGTLPEISGNFDACKNFYLAELARFQVDIDPEKIGEAKTDLTKLRGEIKRLDRIRIDEATRLKAPITKMESQVKELTGLIEKTIEKISSQVKAVEEKTRKLCKELMETYLKNHYGALEVREEYRTGYPMIESLVGISMVTSKGALTKAARESIEGLANQGRNAQLQHDGRLEKLKARCLEVGLENSLQPEYIEAFISEPDSVFLPKLERLISTSLENQKKAQAAAIAKETARIQAEEKAKAEAAAAENARLAKQKADDDARLAKIETDKQAKADQEAREKKEAEEKANQKQEPEKKPVEAPIIPPKAETPKEEVKTSPCSSVQERVGFKVMVEFEIRTFPNRTEKMVELVIAEIRKTSFADSFRHVTFSEENPIRTPGPKLVKTKDEGRDIVYGDNPDFVRVQHSEEKTRRWSIDHYGVFKQLSTGRLYAIDWATGATESQEEQPFEYDEPDFAEVFPEIESVTTYKMANK